MFEEMMGCPAPALIQKWIDANFDGTWKDEVRIGVLTGFVRFVGGHVERVRSVSRISSEGQEDIINRTEEILSGLDWQQAERMHNDFV